MRLVPLALATRIELRDGRWKWGGRCGSSRVGGAGWRVAGRVRNGERVDLEKMGEWLNPEVVSEP